MNKPGRSWHFRFLRTFCPPGLIEEIEGDLLQLYQHDVKHFGRRRARRRMFWSTLRFMRLGFILRNTFSNTGTSFTMKYVFQFAVRHLVKDRRTATIHIAGLTLGIAVCVIIALFVRLQLSFDNGSSKLSSLHRVNSVFTEGGINIDLYATPVPLAQTIRTEITGVKNVVAVRPLFETKVEVTPGKVFNEDRVLVAEQQFLEMFDCTILKGDSKKALAVPYQAVLSTSLAMKFFGNENPIGKTIRIKDNDFTVVAIMEDAPANTSLPASMLLSYSDNKEFLDNGDTWYFGDFSWVKLQPITFISLEPNADVKNVTSQLEQIARRHIDQAPELSPQIHASFILQPLRDIHFDTERFGGGPWVSAINVKWIWFFTAIGSLVLILACINFLNLSTARALTRAKEVGIRKVIGARQGQLVIQFLTEAFVLVTSATFLSLLIVQLSLPSVNSMIGQKIALEDGLSAKAIGATILGVFVISFVAGIYPAWMIAKFSPSVALKSGFSSGGKRTDVLMRRGLVTMQFIVSSFLVAAVIIISRQVQFMSTKDPGFDYRSIVTIEIPVVEKGRALANELRRHSEIEIVSLSRSAPISNDHWWNSISTTSGNERRYPACSIHADEHFYDLYNLKLLSGRIPESTAEDNPSTDETYVVVNEKLLHVLGLGDYREAIGKHFWWGGETVIAGVVADFNTEPMRFDISPTIISHDPSLYAQANIRFDPQIDFAQAIIGVERTWKTVFPTDVFEMKALDQQMRDFYDTESRIYRLFSSFATLAVIISCLGLSGLITYTNQKRLKEVGIRKTMGATRSAIVFLLSRDFLITVIVAFAIASPVVYVISNKFLSTMPYRVEVGLEIFLITGAILTTAVALTTAGPTYRAANVDPAKLLRSE
jgi:ABC-type antimicrobial peptide transport system permease subunit